MRKDHEEMRFFSTALISVGAVIMIVATYRYLHLLKYNREETYSRRLRANRMENVSLALMFIFIAGFFGGILDTLLREVEPIYMFIAFIFLLGSIFIFASVQVQKNMAEELRAKTMETMKAFVNAIDMKDAYTKGHSGHVYHIVDALYEHLDDKAKEAVNKPKLMDAAMLHDIGKISIKDDILNKPGKLTEEEWDVVKTHPANGQKMLEDTCFRDIGKWVLYHHERVDGKGYYGIEPQNLPLEARILAVADTYSALCTNRAYRPKKDHAQAIAIMNEAAGTQLDPALMRIFARIDPSAIAPADVVEL